MVKIKKRASNQQEEFQFDEIPNYRDVSALAQFLRARGGISSRFFTGVDAYTQRRITKAIKRARHLGLLPFVTKAR